MTQWTPDQPAVHPDLPPAPVSGGVYNAEDVREILVAQVLSLVGQVRQKQLSAGNYKDLSYETAAQLVAEKMDQVRVQLAAETNPDENMPETVESSFIEAAAYICAAIEAASIRSKNDVG